METAADIHAVLAPFGVARSHDRPFAHGPPLPEVTVLVAAAAAGTADPIDPPRSKSRLPYPRSRDEPLRHRAAVIAPGKAFDQTGFELPPAPEPPAEAPGQDSCSTTNTPSPTRPTPPCVLDRQHWLANADEEYLQADLSACTAQASAPESGRKLAG